MKTYITPAFPYKGTRIAVLQISDSRGDQFKIMKRCINYIRGVNVESYKLLGSASVFDNLDECLEKFAKLVNTERKARGKSPIKITTE